MNRVDAWRRIQRRAAEGRAQFLLLSTHRFRGVYPVTVFHRHEQRLLLDRTGDEITLDEGEGVAI
ncbi:MAG TPA: hypothetical protein VH855_10390 [Acetobacteraceae bacterium]|jgi:hypothetical protein